MHGNGTVCDVGGGVGHLLAALLEAHSGMRGVLFDRPSAIHQAKQASGNGPICCIGMGPPLAYNFGTRLHPSCPALPLDCPS